MYVCAYWMFLLCGVHCVIEPSPHTHTRTHTVLCTWYVTKRQGNALPWRRSASIVWSWRNRFSRFSMSETSSPLQRTRLWLGYGAHSKPRWGLLTLISKIQPETLTSEPSTLSSCTWHTPCCMYLLYVLYSWINRIHSIYIHSPIQHLSVPWSTSCFRLTEHTLLSWVNYQSKVELYVS